MLKEVLSSCCWPLAYSLFSSKLCFYNRGGPALYRGSICASHPAAPGSNRGSTQTHLVVSSAYERGFANAISGKGMIIRTTTTKISLKNVSIIEQENRVNMSLNKPCVNLNNYDAVN